MKAKSLVIADQHAAVNSYFGLVQTACHALETCLLKVGGYLIDVNHLFFMSTCVGSDEGEVITG